VQQALSIRAGKRAFERIRDHGLDPSDIEIVPGAAGGPKALGIAGLDRAMFGECLEADDGRVVRVAAADENLVEVRCKDADALARAAYHLGNRHTPVQVGAGWLRLAADDVLAGMLRGLGALVTPVRAPFEPEAGAYAAGHHAHSSDAKHAGIIHDFAVRRGDAG
jgi:hypothetical protein